MKYSRERAASPSFSEASERSSFSRASFDQYGETGAEDDVDDTAVTHAVRINRRRTGTLDNPSAESTQLYNVALQDPGPAATASPTAVRTSMPVLVASKKMEIKTIGSPTLSEAEIKSQRSPIPILRPTTPAPPVLVWKKRSYPSDSGVGSDTARSAAWIQLENALQGYLQALATAQADRFNIIQTVLLAFLRRADAGMERLAADRSQAARQRQILFSWLDVLAGELKNAPSNRGACLDGVAGILERLACW